MGATQHARTMAYEQHFIKDARNKARHRIHVRMFVDGSVVRTDELQEGTATDPGAIWKPLHAQACDNDFEALAYADGQEFVRLTTGGWRLAAPDGKPLSEGGDILSLRPRHPGPWRRSSQRPPFSPLTGMNTSSTQSAASAKSGNGTIPRQPCSGRCA